MNRLVLPPALRLLLRMQVRARLRKVGRGAKTVKGAVFLCVMLGMFVLWIGPTVAVGLFVPRTDPSLVRSYLAPGLLGFTLAALFSTGPESGIFFFPAEVDLLFPAPFRRRELLLYRLTGLSLGVLFTALMFSAFLIPHVRFWIFGFCGIALAMAFIQLVPITLTLIISIVGERAYTRGRRIALVATALLLAAAGVQATARQTAGGTIEFFRQLRSTKIAAGVLAPFDVFSRMITADEFFPDFLGWGAVALAIDGVLVALVLRLDANFLESSITASQKLYLKLERMRSGQALMNLARPTAVRWRFPVFPCWRGAGPVAWRQLVSALRGSRGMIYLLLLIFTALTLPVILLGHEEPVLLIVPAAGILPMLSLFLLPQMLQFDFRGDLDRMDLLKTLPASPTAIAAGELLTPVLFATLFELPFATGIGLLQSDWGPIGLAVAAFIPAVNLFIFALENLVFLWFPYRMANLGAGDFQAFGRQMVIMFVKFVVLSIAGSLAAGLGAVTFALTDHSWLAALAVAWCIITCLGLALTPLVAFAFEKFDPSRDTVD